MNSTIEKSTEKASSGGDGQEAYERICVICGKEAYLNYVEWFCRDHGRPMILNCWIAGKKPDERARLVYDYIESKKKEKSV